MQLAQLWRAAIAPLIVRHPDPARTVVLEVHEDEPVRLSFHVRNTPDTRYPDVIVDDFAISTVRLECWPGDALARMWVAAAWSAYILHEALELVTIGDLVTRPLDPHAPGFAFCTLRRGFPAELTPETLFHALLVVMSTEAATSLMTSTC